VEQKYSFRLGIPLAAMLVSALVNAQPQSSACFSYVYNATAAETKELLQQALNGFEVAGCPAALQTKVVGLTSSTTPTVEAGMYLLYRQSQKRLNAMKTSGATVFPGSSGGDGGGTSAAYVWQRGAGGNVILKPVNPLLDKGIGGNILLLPPNQRLETPVREKK
jgi:hypothetical protein